MHNRTRVIVAAAVTAALAAGSTAAAVASTTGAKPGATAKTVSVSAKTPSARTMCATDSDLAARLGVSSARFDQAARAVKTSLGKAGTQPTDDQVDAALARELGIPQARVRQAFAAEKPCAAKPAGSKAGGAKVADSAAAERLGHEALAAAVARELHVSAARVNAAFQPLFAAGHADPSSPIFVAAARSLGVSTQQLTAAVRHAKESLAAGS